MVNAVELIPYQECSSSFGWVPVRVPSTSTADAYYTVMVSPWATKESICECKGYMYRGACTHQDRAAKLVCRWSELSSPQQQNPDERKHKVCPKCGGRTRWEVEVVED